MTRLRAGMFVSYGRQAEVLSGAATTSAFAFATSLSEISVLVPVSKRGPRLSCSAGGSDVGNQTVHSARVRADLHPRSV